MMRFNRFRFHQRFDKRELDTFLQDFFNAKPVRDSFLVAGPRHGAAPTQLS